MGKWEFGFAKALLLSWQEEMRMNNYTFEGLSAQGRGCYRNAVFTHFTSPDRFLVCG